MTAKEYEEIIRHQIDQINYLEQNRIENAIYILGRLSPHDWQQIKETKPHFFDRVVGLLNIE